ncbi:MAG: carbohydrate kinase family protein [Erysipelotrichales bacterium]|nr:carbohydrate kinase family protein [Erysipelotrichales bacterium]MBQ2310342.1 carbohydrate kinase family protein [Erysipelotrichales bacterium]
MINQREIDVLCAGIATWDTIFTGVDPDFLRMDGMTAKGYFASSGGDAVNAAVNMARLGMKVSVAACIGKDSAGELVKQDLLKAGARTGDLTERGDVHTASPVLLVDTEGDRHILRVPDNANYVFSEEMVTEEMLRKAGHLHFASANVLPGIDGKPLGRLFQKAHSLGLTTSLDVTFDKDGKWLDNIEDALDHCDIFIPSLQEAKMYARSEDLKEITAFFRKWPIRIFGVKLGKEGVYLTDFKEEWRLPTLYHGIPVDTTGAGDAFLAGFVSAWLKGYDIPSSGAAGSAQSASVLGKTGANTGAGSWDDAKKLCETNGIRLRMRR